VTYYADKLDALADLFGAPAELARNRLRVRECEYPIIDDVIVLLPHERCPVSVRAEIERTKSLSSRAGAPDDTKFSQRVQTGFGLEWQEYGDILPEHADEFRSYFDVVDLEALKGRRVCDLGCGNGRWSHFVAPYCGELVLVDFSEAIFVARRNLAGVKGALFFMGDVTVLPFRKEFAEFAFCLGVLHHLPTPALDAVAGLGAYTRSLLVYLYYALDNRPAYFRALLALVTSVRRRLSRIESRRIRRLVALGIAVGVYEPLVIVGHLFDMVGRGRMVPLFEAYRGKSLKRVQQDAYDRFFTSIEQRVSREQIVRELSPRFQSVVVSARPPYWHFVCTRS